MKDTEAYLRRMTVEILHFLSVKNAFVQVFLLKNGEMRTLAEKTGKKPAPNHPVNVLSFPETVKFPPVGKLRPLGEVYLNYKWAEGKKEVLAYLLIHGILHLLGYRHAKIRDTIKMEKLERNTWRHVLSSA